MKYLILFLAILMYILVIAIQEKKVLFTSITAGIVIILGMILPNTIFPIKDLSNTTLIYEHTHAFIFSLTKIINWNVIMIYLGSMIIASLFLYSNVPSRIADAIINNSKNSALAIVLILAMTGIISIFVENVATVLLMAPIALSLCKKMNMNPTFFMTGLAVMSNLEGTATLVGDPPSMIFASYAGYNFNDFFFHLGKISIFFFIQIGLIVGCVYFYCYFTKIGKEKIQVSKSTVISWTPLTFLLIMIFGLAGVSFIPSDFEYISGFFVLGLSLIALLWYYIAQKKTKNDVLQLIKELDWETIFFLLGIFVVVGAIQEVGLLEDFAKFLSNICAGSEFLAFIMILLVSVLISGFVDNVPYIIAMLPVAGSLAVQMGFNKEVLMFALLIGSCLGGNLTPYGAAANVASMGIVKKEGYPIGFSDWLKVSVPFTVLTTGFASLALWLVWA